MAVTLSWGKCRIFGQEASGDLFEFYTPVDGSTSLETTEGEKTEAKIEGGENEAVKYARNTYALTWQARLSSDRFKEIEDADGKISGTYSIILVPEDASALCLCIEKAQLKSSDSYSSADGALQTYTADALVAPTGNQIKWGTCTITESSGSVTKVVFVEKKQTSPKTVTLQ